MATSSGRGGRRHDGRGRGLDLRELAVERRQLLGLGRPLVRGVLAPAAGRVREVAASLGAQVEPGSVLVVLEDVGTGAGEEDGDAGDLDEDAA
ncbi:hypothetical protein AB6N23_08075 [Cellulomonas sp. 179-A 9B4 NHS]|uniref:hypothetical protein n=1 Tax=Cellulomonas sp. 179-A 9B4 NHS TaxID=3142379 RepID=UPI00399EF8D6